MKIFFKLRDETLNGESWLCPLPMRVTNGIAELDLEAVDTDSPRAARVRAHLRDNYDSFVGQG